MVLVGVLRHSGLVAQSACGCFCRRRGVSPALRLWTFALERIMRLCVCCWPCEDNRTSAQTATQTGMEMGNVKGSG